MCCKVIILYLEDNTIVKEIPCENESTAKMIKRSKDRYLPRNYFITELQKETIWN